MRALLARWHRDGIPPAAAIAIIAAAVGLGLAGAAARGLGGPAAGTPPVRVVGGPTDTAASSTPPPVEVRQVHETLHGFRAWCRPGADTQARRQLERGARMIVRFARHYPQARFPIDDETGTALSVLLVTRNELRECAPAAAAVADRAIPAEVRRGLAPLPPLTRG